MPGRSLTIEQILTILRETPPGIAALTAGLPLDQLMSPYMIRIAVKPETVHILDFETRFPSAIAAAMASQQAG